MDTTFLQRYRMALLVAVGGVGSYKWIGDLKWAQGDTAALPLMTKLDESIPFLPWTIWFYLPLFVVTFHYGVWAIKTRRVFVRTVVSLALAWVLCYPLFWWFPTAYPRQVAPNDGSLTNALLTGLQAFDPPTNTFPSLHVADMGCVALGVWRDNKRRGALAGAMALLPALSILTTKQHFVADMLAGALVAYLAHSAAFAGFKREA